MRESGAVLVMSQKEAENKNTEGQKGMMENLKKNSAVICIRSHTGRKQKVHYSARAIEQAKTGYYVKLCVLLLVFQLILTNLVEHTFW